jgi:hypothetical protein
MINHRLVRKLDKLHLVWQFAPNPVADIADSRVEVHNALVAACAPYPQDKGQILTDFPSVSLTTPAAGIPCNQLVKSQLRAKESRDVLRDAARDSAVYGVLSKKRYTGGIANITGIEVKWMSQGCPTLLTAMKYEVATNRMYLSIDGGSTWTVGISVPAVGGYGYATAVGGVDAAIVYFEVTGALPATDQIDVLTIDDARYTIMYQSYVTGALGGNAITTPYALPASTYVIVVTPVVVDFGSVPVNSEWSNMDMAFSWTDPIQPAASPGSAVTGYGALVIPAQNSFTLPAVPLVPALTDLFVYGSRPIYGMHYTLAGAVGTWLPAAAGFNLETADAGNTFVKVY